MAQDPSRPIFLERRSYRRRRMMDAVRLLPLVGLFLWMIPVFWPVSAQLVPAQTTTPAVEAISLSGAMIYIFVVWVVLILSAAALWGGLRKTAEDPDQPLNPRP